MIVSAQIYDKKFKEFVFNWINYYDCFVLWVLVKNYLKQHRRSFDPGAFFDMDKVGSRIRDKGTVLFYSSLCHRPL